MVARLNREALEDSRLEEFLFGAQRIPLDPVRQPLRELQNNRCFYWDSLIRGRSTVNHFLPWVRHPDNGIENLVVPTIAAMATRATSFRRWGGADGASARR